MLKSIMLLICAPLLIQAEQGERLLNKSYAMFFKDIANFHAAEQKFQELNSRVKKLIERSDQSKVDFYAYDDLKCDMRLAAMATTMAGKALIDHIDEHMSDSRYGTAELQKMKQHVRQALARIKEPGDDPVYITSAR